MKTKIYILIIVLTVFIGVITTELSAKGTPAGTRITNFASVDYSGVSKSNSISTQVMAIYGMIPTSYTQSNITSAGGVVPFTYEVSNNGNTDMDYIVTLNNFTNISASNYKAWLSLDTSQTMQGSVILITNNIPMGSTSMFTLYIRTDINSPPGDWGQIPMTIQASNSLAVNTNGGYLGDNTIFYGGTNYLVFNPKVTVAGPYIVLRKTLSISHTPIYLANGGDINIPVPDSVITYTNYYDNDGNSGAVDLKIIDRIPRDTDFINGSLMPGMLHIGANIGVNVTISYRDRNGNSCALAGVPGEADPNIGEILLDFSFNAGSAVAGDNNDPGDVYGTALGGQYNDVDAGYFYYKVVVHRRR